MKKELELKIEVVPPKLDATFMTFEVALKSYTKQFEIEVTSENIKEAKSSSAELNKLRTQIKATAKKYLEEVEKPINEFKARLLDLDNIIVNKRDIIVKDVSVFDDAKKLEHHGVMLDYLTSRVTPLLETDISKDWLYELQNKLPSASIAGLTDKGALKKQHKDAIDALTNDVEERHRQVSIEAENQKLRDEVRANEIIRQRDIEERKESIKNQQVEEPQQDLFNQPPSCRPQQNGSESYSQPQQNDTSANYSEIPNSSDGKSIYSITATFNIRAKAGLPVDLVAQKSQASLFKDGVTPEVITCIEHT